MTPSSAHSNARPRISFLYLGRNPAFGTFVCELAEVAQRRPALDCEFLVTRGTELADRLRALGVKLLVVPAYHSSRLAHVSLGYLAARKRVLAHLDKTRPRAVVTLMPHIWSPLLAPAIRRRGITYATTIHDVEPHPGDPTAWLTRWLASDASRADMVFALSRSVAEMLAARKLARPDRIVRLFHPDLGAGANAVARRAPSPRAPFRVLFFGRIMAYKGLAVLVEAVERLRQDGHRLEIGVAGAGNLDALRPRLQAMNAEIIDRWIPAEELRQLLQGYDAIACSHVEASQSGVAALAFGHGIPVIGMPVGGLVEQVLDGKTGVLARDASANAFACALKRLATEPQLYETITRNLAATASERSMSRFLDALLASLARRLPRGAT